MNKNHYRYHKLARNPNSRMAIVLMSPLFLVATLPYLARAQLVDPFDEVVEILMHAQLADGLILGNAFGPDNASPLVFDSTANHAAKTFSYQSTSGLEYLASDFHHRTSGGFNSMRNMWEWTSSGSLGDQDWNGDGAASVLPEEEIVVIAADGATKDTKFKLDLTTKWITGNTTYFSSGKIELTGTIGFPPTIKSSKFDELKIEKQVNGGEKTLVAKFSGTDKLEEDGSYSIDADLEFILGQNTEFNMRSRGFSDPLSPTGSGSFTMLVPEPAALSLALVGVVILSLTTAGRRREWFVRRGQENSGGVQ